MVAIVQVFGNLTKLTHATIVKLHFTVGEIMSTTFYFICALSIIVSLLAVFIIMRTRTRMAVNNKELDKLEEKTEESLSRHLKELEELRSKLREDQLRNLKCQC